MERPTSHPTPDGRDTRERIQREAAILFRDQGYDSTTMRAIATRVGITPGALYWHFPSKSDILFTFLERSVTDALEQVEQASNQPTPREQLRELVRIHVRLQLAELELSKAYGILHGVTQLASRLPESQKQQHRAVQKRWLNYVRQTLRAGMEAGQFRDLDITVTALAIISLCDYVVTWFRPGGRLSPLEVATLYADLVLHMVIR
jgi:AcrR family transcriptional regulator